MAFGVSFVPGQNGQNGEGRQGRTGAPDSRYQQAIKILSLRLPKVRGATGGGGIAPAPLLRAAGAMGQPTAAMGGTQPLTSEIARAFLQMAGLAPGMAQQGGAMPPRGVQPRMATAMRPRTPQAPPRVIPGIDTMPGGMPEIPTVTREWPPQPEEPISQFQLPQTVPQEFPTFYGGGSEGIDSDDGLDYFDQLRRRIAGGGGY